MILLTAAPNQANYRQFALSGYATPEDNVHHKFLLIRHIDHNEHELVEKDLTENIDAYVVDENYLQFRLYSLNVLYDA